MLLLLLLEYICTVSDLSGGGGSKESTFYGPLISGVRTKDKSKRILSICLSASVGSVLLTIES